MRLILRVFAPSADAAEAAEVSRRLVDALAEFSPRLDGSPEQYWKVPEWYEHTFLLTPASKRVFDAVIARARSGWHHTYGDPDRSSVWNPSPGSTFLLPEVMWAEVLLVPPNQPEE